jgi:4-amino-4-deoxy-L-arabinose transferase-like glycosyltransferase
MPHLLRVTKKIWLPAAIVLLYLYNFPYFAAIHSANELPRIYLTMAIVDRGALNIDPELRRFQPTPDTSSYRGKLYANKAPGMSFLTIPVYWVQKLASGGRTPELPRMFFWFRIFGSMIPALLFLLLLWRFLGELVPDEGDRRMVLAAYALGTMAMTYGTLLIAHQLSALLMATSYILVFLRARRPDAPGLPRLFHALAGLAAGGGILVDYQVAFIAPPVGLYLLWVARRRGPRRLLLSAVQFGAAAAVPLAVLLLYQWGCFDDPFKTGYHYPTTPLFQEWHSKGFLGMHRWSRTAFWGSFFRPDNGLFYFSPFLLLALPGLAWMFIDRRLRADGVLCLVLIVFFVIFVSSLTFWRSGWAVGPRYITCAIPFYLVPVAVLVGKLAERWYGRIIPYGLMALSILIYVTANAVFPHYPENFSNPWFDVTLRFGRAGYLPYNLGWLLGLHGLASAVPYLVVLGGLLAALLWGRTGRLWQRAVVAVGAVALAFSILLVYHHQLSDRRMPVPVAFLPWMERMWEPRHEGMHLDRLLPAGDPRTVGLATRRR